MRSIQTLIAALAGLEARLAACTRCGMCQAVCPLYLQTGREPDVARGKLALLDGLAAEMFADPRGVLARLDRCLLCGKCEAHCPRGVKTLEIFLEARGILNAFLGFSPAKRLLVRHLLASPARLDRFARWGGRLQQAVTRPASPELGTRRFRWRDGRHMPALPLRSFSPSLPVPAGDGLRVAFFTGCAIDKLFPRVGEAVLAALSFHGAGIFLPEGQGCCGLPALAAGDREGFERLLRFNLDLLAAEPFDLMVTACGSCTMTLKHLWPRMVRDPALAPRVARLAARTLDIHQFIAGRFPLPETGRGGDSPAFKVTYHDPCHLRGSLGVAEEPRALIRANPAAVLTEMAAPGACCGMGGSFNLGHYPLSRAIGERKLTDIAAAGCQVVATGCPACMIQLADLISHAGLGIRVRHAIEIYADALPR